MNPLIEIMQSPKTERETILFFFSFLFWKEKTKQNKKSPQIWDITTT